MANSSNDAVKVVGTVVLMCMLFSVPYMAEAITCGKVLQDLVLPCYSYLRKGGAVTSGCCGAVRDVNSAAQTTTDRRVVCGCLQSAPRLIREINSSRLASLPGKCGVSIPYKISPSTHCSKCPTGSPPYNRTTSTTSRAGSGTNNFDTSMVIILAALLCALICTLGLNSIIRCALRCSRRFRVSTHNNENIVSRLPDIGLKRQVLCQIPVTIYGGNKNVFVAPTDCPICLGEFIEGEKCRILPKCNHGFHVNCIDTWLLSHSSCPICRYSLLELPTAQPLSEGSGNTPLADRGVTVIIDDVS